MLIAPAIPAPKTVMNRDNGREREKGKILVQPGDRIFRWRVGTPHVAARFLRARGEAKSGVVGGISGDLSSIN